MNLGPLKQNESMADRLRRKREGTMGGSADGRDREGTDFGDYRNAPRSIDSRLNDLEGKLNRILEKLEPSTGASIRNAFRTMKTRWVNKANEYDSWSWWIFYPLRIVAYCALFFAGSCNLLVDSCQRGNEAQTRTDTALCISVCESVGATFVSRNSRLTNNGNMTPYSEACVCAENHTIFVIDPRSGRRVE